MADNTPQLLSMAQEFTGLPMDSLIGAPLTAAATANASMAVTQTKFMLDTCFQKVVDSKGEINYNPIMIKMSLTRGFVVPATPAIPEVKDDKGVVTQKAVDAQPATMSSFTTSFDLPLLTIVPLNALGVDEVDITFEMEVKSSFSNTQSEESATKAAAEATLEAKFQIGPFSAKITGKASYSSEDKKTSNSHYEKSNSAKYTVHVHAGQLPLAKGVNTIIEAFTQAIQPYQMPNAVDESKKTA
ncbi:MAG: DUF2589 domain-containing protein [Bacteroidetes bacterium]|nr:MAG: DUF2589 domain-containing protein [Bacteroidota bacterium]